MSLYELQDNVGIKTQAPEAKYKLVLDLRIQFSIERIDNAKYWKKPCKIITSTRINNLRFDSIALDEYFSVLANPQHHLEVASNGLHIFILLQLHGIIIHSGLVYFVIIGWRGLDNLRMVKIKESFEWQHDFNQLTERKLCLQRSSDKLKTLNVMKNVTLIESNMNKWQH